MQLSATMRGGVVGDAISTDQLQGAGIQRGPEVGAKPQATSHGTSVVPEERAVGHDECTSWSTVQATTHGQSWLQCPIPNKRRAGDGYFGAMDVWPEYWSVRTSHGVGNGILVVQVNQDSNSTTIASCIASSITKAL
jgi:hypothetical protein